MRWSNKELMQCLWAASNRGHRGVELKGDKQKILGIGGWISGLSGWLPGGLLSYAQERNLSGQLMNLGWEVDRLKNYRSKIANEMRRQESSILIGISTGGLIALDYVNRYGWERVVSLILIETPLAGVALLGSLPWKPGALSDLACGSDFLSTIQRVKCPEEKVFSIYASNDNLVGDPQKINFSGKKFVVQADGHNVLQYNFHLMANILDSIIYSAAPSKPGQLVDAQ